MVERCATRVHRDDVVATIRVPGQGRRRSEQHTRTFKATLAGLAKLAAWLAGFGVTLVGMEATGVYWKTVSRRSRIDSSAGCSTRITCATCRVRAAQTRRPERRPALHAELGARYFVGATLRTGGRSSGHPGHECTGRGLIDAGVELLCRARATACRQARRRAGGAVGRLGGGRVIPPPPAVGGWIGRCAPGQAARRGPRARSPSSTLRMRVSPCLRRHNRAPRRVIPPLVLAPKNLRITHRYPTILNLIAYPSISL
jgi:hypothetical protein